MLNRSFSWSAETIHDGSAREGLHEKLEGVKFSLAFLAQIGQKTHFYPSRYVPLLVLRMLSYLMAASWSRIKSPELFQESIYMSVSRGTKQ